MESTTALGSLAWSSGRSAGCDGGTSASGTDGHPCRHQRDRAFDYAKYLSSMSKSVELVASDRQKKTGIGEKKGKTIILSGFSIIN